LFYDKKDVAAVEYPTDTNNSFLISNKKKLSEAFSQSKIKLFVGDAFEHGYLYMKRIWWWTHAVNWPQLWITIYF